MVKLVENNRDLVASLLQKISAGSTARSLEGLKVDFKSDGRSYDDTLVVVASAAACFANADGGTVVVGVDDRTPGPLAIRGSNLEAEKVRSRIYEVTDPPLQVEAETFEYEGAGLLMISVVRGVRVHSVKGKLPTERIDDDCQPMTTDRIASVVAERQGQDWSAAETDIPAAASDPIALVAAREMVLRNPKETIRRLAAKGDSDLLGGLGVLTARGTLTNAGALLFTSALGRGVEISYIHRRTPAGALTSNEQLAAPLVLALQRTFELIEARLDRTPVSIGRGQQVHIADLPEAAIREAVVNAAMHREYRQQGRVTIEHTQTQLVVTSPGAFVSGVRPDNLLTTSSRTRNGQLAQALRSLNLAETAGSGVDKMFAEMVRVGHQPPAFTVEGDSVRVSLIGGAPNSLITRFVATLPPEEAEDANTMLVLLRLLSTRTINAQEAMVFLQKVSIEEAQSVLERLSAGDRIQLLEPTRETWRRTFPKYRLREEPLTALGSAVSYRRRTTDQLDRKIIELVRETHTVNARMIKVMLDLDAKSVSRLLGDMVSRGILAKLPGAQRGPGVTYGPGEDFPQRRTTKPKTTSDPTDAYLPFDLE